MFLSNITRVISQPTDIGSIIFPVGTVIPYSGATPSVFGWQSWTSVTDHCLFSTTSLTQATTPASGGPSFSASYGSSTNASHSVLGSSYNHYSLGSTGSSSVFTFIGQDGNHTHSGGTLNSEVYSNLSPRRAQFNFLIATSPQKSLPTNSLVFSSRNNSNLGSLYSQTATTYIAPQPNGVGNVATGTLSETRSVGSGSAGSHRHTSGPFSSVIRSGNFSTSIFQPQFGGAHTHSSSLQYNQTIFGETIILRLYSTLAELPPTGDIIVGYAGDLTKIEAPWYLCDGNNSTIDLRNKFIAVNNNLNVGTVLNTNLTRNPLTTIWSSTHGHQGSFLTSGVIASASFGHTSADWSHTHAISATYNDTPRIAARANLYFIQYKPFIIVPNVLTINEGGSITFNIVTTDIPNGTTLYWTIVSELGNVDANDFTDNAVSGSFVVNGNAATIVRALTNDFTTEGTERFRLQIRTDSTSGEILAESPSITVNDTSVETYAVTPNVTSVNEGESVTFTVTTQGLPDNTTLYWTTTGTVNASDFTDEVVSGSFTINNGTATIVRGITEDFITEGTENFALQIRTGSTSGTVRATSATVTVNDTSQTPTVVPNVTSVNEGSSVTFTVTTAGVANGTTLFWSTLPVSGTVNASDFTDNAVSGSFIVNNNTASIVRTLTNDFTTEGTESFRLEIRTGSTSGTVRATSAIVTINDTSVETYAVTPSVTAVDEGSSVTFTVTTQGVPNNTTLYWTTTGTVNASDFTDNVTSGSFTINNNTASIVRTLRNDFTTEGTENFALQIRTGSTSGTVRATSATVTVNDTSVETYAVTPSVTSVDEGSSVTFTVTTQGVLNGTTLYWTTTGTVNASDFTDNAVSGSFTINNNTGSIVRTLRNDFTTEGTENFALQIRTGSTSGTVRATSATVTVNDASQTPTVVPNVTSVDEGSSVTFTVTTTNVANGTTLFWTTLPVSGTVNASDFTDNAVSGSFTINNNTGSIVRGIRADATTEGTESFALRIHIDSTSGAIIATSATVTINDTSMTPTYAVTPNVTSVNEGSSVTFTVTTTNVANGTTLYWTTTGTVNASDFTDNVTSGSFTINNNTASIVRTLRNDLLEEGTENFALQIRTDAVNGTVRATSATVTVNDTSVPTYAVSPNVTSVNEGSSVTFTVTTTGVANGTTLFWTTLPVTGTVNASDFTDNAVSGSFTINNNTGSIVRGIRADATTEGTESFRLQIRTGSTSGIVRATSSIVTINDTSLTVPGQVMFTTTQLNTGGDTFDAFFWTVPTGVTSISVLCVGGGGGGRQYGTNDSQTGGGGGGGALSYTNNIAVTPGQSIRIEVGRGGTRGLFSASLDFRNAWPGGTTSVLRSGTILVQARGGAGGGRNGAASGGAAALGQGAVRWSGGSGGGTSTSGMSRPSGGGGAAGYQGNGGNGGNGLQTPLVNGQSGEGGGGGGGGAVNVAIGSNGTAGFGGGVGLLGVGSNGAGGVSGSAGIPGNPGVVTSGGPGSGGNIQQYGGGAPGNRGFSSAPVGGAGAVRIIWPGNLRQFPSTRTADE